jgi:DNA repair exonuclease SbcCD ATPase subunit
MTKHSTINLLIIIAVIAAIVFFGFNFLKMNTSFQENLTSLQAALPAGHLNELKPAEATGGAVSPKAVDNTPDAAVEQKEHQRLTGEIENLKKSLDGKDSDLAALRKELAELKTNYLDAAAQKEALIKEKKELADELSDKEAALSSLRPAPDKVAPAPEEVAALKKELSEYKDNLDKVTDLYERLTLQLKNISAALARREEENRHKENQITELKGEISILKTQVSQLNDYLLQSQETHRAIKEKLNVLNELDGTVKNNLGQETLGKQPDSFRGNFSRAAVAPENTADLTRPMPSGNKTEAEELKKKVEVILQSVE